MKAISIDKVASNPTLTLYPQIHLYADSAIGRDVMPLFVPDIPIRWSSNVCIALRILRLGKNISPKFAHRYIDAIGMVNVLQPVLDCDTAHAIINSGTMSIMDSAVTTGHWIDCDITSLSDIEMTVNGHTHTYLTDDLELPRRISAISRLATVKTGDIVILSDTAVSDTLTIGTSIFGSLNGTQCLSLKIR